MEKKEYKELTITQTLEVEIVRSEDNKVIVYMYLPDKEDESNVKEVMTFLKEGMYLLYDRRYFQRSNENEILEILEDESKTFYGGAEYYKIDEFGLFIGENLNEYAFKEFLSEDYDSLKDLTLEKVFFKFFKEYDTPVRIADNGSLYVQRR